MEMGSVTSLVSVTLALLVAMFGAFRYVAAMAESLRKEIAAAEKTATLVAEKAGEAEARQRHQANNNMQTIIAKLESDLRQVQREGVRHEQMAALETRIQGALTKIETKVDKLTEVTAEIGNLRTTLQSLNNRLERISDRLDEQHGVLKNTRA